MSARCQEDGQTADAREMSRVMLVVEIKTGVYSVGSRTTEVYPGWMKDRSNWRMGARVNIAEVMLYAGLGYSSRIGLERVVCNKVGSHGRRFQRNEFQDKMGLQQTGKIRFRS